MDFYFTYFLFLFIFTTDNKWFFSEKKNDCPSSPSRLEIFPHPFLFFFNFLKSRITISKVCCRMGIHILCIFHPFFETANRSLFFLGYKIIIEKKINNNGKWLLEIGLMEFYYYRQPFPFSFFLFLFFFFFFQLPRGIGNCFSKIKGKNIVLLQIK